MSFSRSRYGPGEKGGFSTRYTSSVSDAEGLKPSWSSWEMLVRYFVIAIEIVRFAGAGGRLRWRRLAFHTQGNWRVSFYVSWYCLNSEVGLEVVEEDRETIIWTAQGQHGRVPE